VHSCRMPIVWNSHDQARVLIGCAIGHVCVGTDEDIRQAKSAISRAIRLLVTSGMTQAQAVHTIITHAEMLGSLE
jgi:hypothetical protein